MQQITLRLPEDTLESLEEEAEEHGVSRSEYIRDVLESRDDVDESRPEYEDQIEELKRENDRLRDQLAATNTRVEEHTELVRYVEDELSYRQAGLGTRMKWWLFGKGGK